jgi:hypothetical protein
MPKRLVIVVNDLPTLVQVTGLNVEWQHTVCPAYNGSGTPENKPPDWMGRSFDANHSHQISKGSTDLDAEDLTLLANHVRKHGLGRGGRSGKLVLMMNPDDVEESGLTSWRAGVTTNNGKVSKYDFIVSPTAPAYLTSESVVGEKPPAEYENIPVIGSFGPISYVVHSEAIPAGFLAISATGGSNSDINPIAFREHESAEYRGLMYIPGDDPRAYPLSNSFALRTFGCGFRRRGAAVIAQLTAGAYTAPASFAL